MDDKSKDVVEPIGLVLAAGDGQDQGASALDGREVAMDPRWFEGEGWFAVAIAATFFLVAGGILLWIRGPGSRPLDPPVAHENVRWFAIGCALFGCLWLVRAVAGIGGFVAVCGIMLAMGVAFRSALGTRSGTDVRAQGAGLRWRGLGSSLRPGRAGPPRTGAPDLD